MTAVQHPSIFSTNYQPLESASAAQVDEESLERASDRLLDDTERALDTIYDDAGIKSMTENVGLTLVHLQLKIEARSEEKIQQSLDASKALREQAADLTQFLQALEAAQVENPKAKKISLKQEDAHLIGKVYNIVQHDYFKQTEWTPEQVTAIIRIIPRHTDKVFNDINAKMTELNRLVEDRQEFLTIFRDLLKMLQDMHQVFIRNQVQK